MRLRNLCIFDSFIGVNKLLQAGREVVYSIVVSVFVFWMFLILAIRQNKTLHSVSVMILACEAVRGCGFSSDLAADPPLVTPEWPSLRGAEAGCEVLTAGLD